MVAVKWKWNDTVLNLIYANLLVAYNIIAYLKGLEKYRNQPEIYYFQDHQMLTLYHYQKGLEKYKNLSGKVTTPQKGLERQE